MNSKKDNLQFDAERDIKNGEIQLIDIGFPLLPNDEIHLAKKLDSLQLKYGFKQMYFCSPPPDSEGQIQMKEYNEKVIEYLSNRNGKGWYNKYRKTVDSLYKLAYPKK